MSQRASAWSVTMNMKNISRERCDEFIACARQNNWTVEGQLEQGEEGTPHYQLLVRTPQVRFSAVKKMFPTAHIEVARNVSALKSYVHKADTRVEELKQVENRFVTWRQVRDKFFSWYVDNYPSQLQYEVDDEEKKKYWDMFISLSIREGIECDVIGVNPQYRLCIQKYWSAYLEVAIDRWQPDSQNVMETEDSQTASSPLDPLV